MLTCGQKFLLRIGGRVPVKPVCFQALVAIVFVAAVAADVVVVVAAVVAAEATTHHFQQKLLFSISFESGNKPSLIEKLL